MDICIPRKQSTRLGRKPAISAETCRMLVSPSKNPVRDQQYEVQIEYHRLPVKKRSLQARLKQCTNGGQRYKQAYIQKEISVANRRKRYEFGLEHQDKTIDQWWQFITFTDEAHIDPTSQGQGHILRERGTRYNTENIQERGERKGVRLHIAGWVNWHTKCKKLKFYNDENDEIQPPPRPRKPVKRKYESQEDFEARIREWEASIGHEREVKPKGNAMTQKYYTERLLPVYIKTFEDIRVIGPRSWLLQEDGDPSHGMKKKGLAQALKEKHMIDNLIHPPQSPDLNPIEGIWNILKPRERRRKWRTLEELKAIIQEEWDKITMDEVRARISEMPDRCKRLVKSGGGPIGSALW